MDRTCLVHIGLHKTGSTTIQKMLGAEEVRLEKHGFYFPRAGRDTSISAHHRLAWELNRRKGFDGSRSFNTLSRELTAANFPEKIVLSSEDFSTRIHLPRVVGRIERKMMRLGYRPRIIAYVRPQETAVQSIYTQRLKVWGIRTDFDSFWPTAIEDIRLDYDKRFTALLAAKGIDLQIFPFCSDMIGQGICRHFLSVIGIPPEGLADFVEPPPSNVSPGPKTIAAAVAIANELDKRGMRMNQENLEVGAFLLRRISATIGSDTTKFNALTPEIVAKVRAYFRESNARFSARVFGRAWEDVFAAELASEHELNVFDRAKATPKERHEFDEFVANMTEVILESAVSRREQPGPLFPSG